MQKDLYLIELVSIPTSIYYLGTADSRGRPDEPAAADVAATVEPDACHGTVPLERRLHLLFVTDCTACDRCVLGRVRGVWRGRREGVIG